MLTAEDWSREVQIETKITTENKLLIMRGDYFVAVQMWKKEEIIEAPCMEPTRTNVEYGSRERETDNRIEAFNMCVYI